MKFNMSDSAKEKGARILDEVYKNIKSAASSDYEEFYLNRYLFQRLRNKEQKDKKEIKEQLYTKNPKCHYCGESFATDKGVHLHRKNSERVYHKSNCVLVHKGCHPAQEKADNKNKNRVHTNKSNSIRKENTQASKNKSTAVKVKGITSGKDYSEYWFQGEKYKKGPLVLAIVKQYLQDNRKTSYANLSRKFPDELQGSTGVFRRKEEIEYKDRYFMDDTLLIGDGIEIAVCRKWAAVKGKRNTTKQDIDNFIKHVKKNLGYKIRKAR